MTVVDLPVPPFPEMAAMVTLTAPILRGGPAGVLAGDQQVNYKDREEDHDYHGHHQQDHRPDPKERVDPLRRDRFRDRQWRSADEWRDFYRLKLPGEVSSGVVGSGHYRRGVRDGWRGEAHAGRLGRGGLCRRQAGLGIGRRHGLSGRP